MITFNYVPYNVTGTFRVMRFVKYLPKYGIIPIVITADQGEHHINKDLYHNIPSEAHVYRLKSLFTDSQNRIKKSGILYDKNVVNFKRIRNFFIRLAKDLLLSPDVQITWCILHLRKIKKIIRSHNINTILITGGPFPYSY